MLVLAMCASLAACDGLFYAPPGREAPLSDFAGAHFGVTNSAKVDGSQHLSGYAFVKQPRHSDDCLAIRSDVGAELNGAALAVKERGSTHNFMGRWCEDPYLVSDLPVSMLDGSDGLLVISDSETRFEVGVAHLFDPQDLVPAAPLSTVTPGSDVALTWHRPEAWGAPGFEVDPVLATVGFFYPQPKDGQQTFYADTSTSATGLVIHPPTSLPSGPATLQVSMAVGLGTLSCAGTNDCQAIYTIERELPIQVQ